MAKKSKGTDGSAYRSAKTGRFVTESYAKRNPRITVKEKNVALRGKNQRVSETVPVPKRRRKVLAS